MNNLNVDNLEWKKVDCAWQWTFGRLPCRWCSRLWRRRGSPWRTRTWSCPSPCRTDRAPCSSPVRRVPKNVSETRKRATVVGFCQFFCTGCPGGQYFWNCLKIILCTNVENTCFKWPFLCTGLFAWILLRKLKHLLCCLRDLFIFLVRHI